MKGAKGDTSDFAIWIIKKNAQERSYEPNQQ